METSGIFAAMSGALRDLGFLHDSVVNGMTTLIYTSL